MPPHWFIHGLFLYPIYLYFFWFPPSFPLFTPLFPTGQAGQGQGLRGTVRTLAFLTGRGLGGEKHLQPTA